MGAEDRRAGGGVSGRGRVTAEWLASWQAARDGFWRKQITRGEWCERQYALAAQLLYRLPGS